MLGKERFVESLLDEIREILGEEICMKEKMVQKNNGICRRGIVLCKEDTRLAPVIYMDELYEIYLKGRSIEEIADIAITEIRKEQGKLMRNYQDVLDYETMKDRIVFRLINYDKNKELLQGVPHRKFLDLAIVYYLHLGEENDYATVSKITKPVMDIWEISEEELYQQALINSARLLPVRCANLHTILFGADDTGISEMVPELYIMTNTTGTAGAATMLYENALKEFSEKLDTDVVILPSSIHEILLLPYEESKDRDMKELGEMVSEINRTTVAVQDVLSDSVYLYKRVTKEIQLVGTGQIAKVA